MSRRAIGWTLAGLFIALISGGAAWHFSRPIRVITVIALHVSLDPSLPPDGSGEIWLGRERIADREVWLNLSGRSRRPYERPLDLETGTILSLDRWGVADAILPGIEFDSIEGEPPELPDVIYWAFTPETPVRAFWGEGTLEGERHRWLWVLCSEPDQRPCGLAVRAMHGGVPLVHRDALVRSGARQESAWVKQLTRQEVTEQVIEIRFARPR